MRKVQELDYRELKRHCNPQEFSFQTTEELEPIDEIIGQERAVKAFDFGLAVKMNGYNIYMAGPSGTGKTSYAVQSTKKMAATEPVPMDWCYVYNFQNPKKPIALSFPAGVGRQFKEDMTKLTAILNKELRKAFRTDEYEKQKLAIGRQFEMEQNDLLDEINDLAEEYDFEVKNTETGMYFIPRKNGVVMEEEQYENLTEEEQYIIEEYSQIIQEKAAIVFRKVQESERACEQELENLERSIGLQTIEIHMNEFLEPYGIYEKAVTYINAVKEDILENLDQFMEDNRTGEDNLAGLFPMLHKKPEEDVTLKYGVNLVVDHSETKGAPVVVTFHPTYTNLIGETEYDSEFGSLMTDFMKIKGGLCHQANGGYLIVQTHDILTAPQAWEGLRRVIKTKEIDMCSIREVVGNAAVPTLWPEPIPVEFKVIMVGSEYNYELLNQYDEEFHKFFKIRADFDYEMEHTNQNGIKIARFMKGFVEREHTPEFDASAVSAVIEYASREVNRQDKLSTRFNHISEILGEAVTWARMEKETPISGKHIRKAIREKEQRMMLYREKLEEMMDEDVIMIDTIGEEIGQINGLAVLDMGNYAFGIPSRITATTYVGKSGIVNIEKEARMSGQTHDKGVQIITGFLGQTYAQKFPMSLSCRICFEQNYNGIDGDSASSTELYCILSSLAEIPIRQGIAVTGSVNQKGEIQAIGGVTHKIEGFFDLCKKRGLTGDQGVLIPVSNVKELVLNDEVVEAVKNGLFHIYPIRHIDEGIEILMKYPAGEKNEKGEYPLESVHGKVYQKLAAFAKISSEYA